MQADGSPPGESARHPGGSQQPANEPSELIRVARERERVAAEREQIAEEREALAAERERRADRREQAQIGREVAATEREMARGARDKEDVRGGGTREDEAEADSRGAAQRQQD